MAPTRLLTLACAWIVLAAGAGCSSSVNIGGWQKGVERYVALKGGDPNVLRDSTTAGNRPGFSIIAADDPRKSGDAHGVLLGHKRIDGEPWLIYLVGLVNHQKVQDIRLAVLTYASGKPVWHVGGENPPALKQYQQFNRRLWHDRHPEGGKNVASDYLGFPRDEDNFKLDVDGTRLQATHVASGAQWHLDQRARKR